MFVSKGNAGRISDKELTLQRGFLDDQAFNAKQQCATKSIYFEKSFGRRTISELLKHVPWPEGSSKAIIELPNYLVPYADDLCAGPIQSKYNQQQLVEYKILLIELKTY